MAEAAEVRTVIWSSHQLTVLGFMKSGQLTAPGQSCTSQNTQTRDSC